MKKLIVTFALVLLSQIGFSQDETFKKDVLKVIEMSGAANQMKSAKTQILQMVPKEKQEAFILDFDATMPALYDKIAAISGKSRLSKRPLNIISVNTNS